MQQHNACSGHVGDHAFHTAPSQRANSCLSEEERAIFDEGFQILNQTQRDAWESAVEEAKNQAEQEQGVTFTYPDIVPFQEAVAPMHQEMLDNYPDLAPIYELIQEHNAANPAES